MFTLSCVRARHMLPVALLTRACLSVCLSHAEDMQVEAREEGDKEEEQGKRAGSGLKKVRVLTWMSPTLSCRCGGELKGTR